MKKLNKNNFKFYNKSPFFKDTYISKNLLLKIEILSLSLKFVS